MMGEDWTKDVLNDEERQVVYGLSLEATHAMTSNMVSSARITKALELIKELCERVTELKTQIQEEDDVT